MRETEIQIGNSCSYANPCSSWQTIAGGRAMLCSLCGRPLNADDAFCTGCGTPASKLSEAVGETPVAAAPGPAYPPAGARPAFASFKCPFCQSEAPPNTMKKVSGTGWIVFVILLLFCFPLCWLPFVLDGCKEDVRTCSSCLTRLG